MDILFVYPSSLDTAGRPLKYKKAFLPPLSLASLAGMTPRQHRVTVVNDLVEDIDFARPYDFVGITAMTPQAERAYQISASFRKKGVPVILGGVHPTVLPEEAKQHADAIVIGEADDLWEGVLHDVDHGSLQSVYQSNHFPDLSRLVIPRWDGFNMRIYPHRLGSKMPLMPIFTTRGCPFGCKFCTVTKIFGKSYRTKPVAHVLAEIEATAAQEYFFIDDNIACNPDYSRELFSALEGKGIRWLSQISTTILHHPELIEEAAKAGCMYLFVGIESLNPASLDLANKKFNKVEEYEELLKRLRAAGIVPFLSFIFGFDSDLPDQFRLTLEFLKRNRIGFAAFWILTPLPGTITFDEMNQGHQIVERRWSFYDGAHAVFRPAQLDREELEAHFWRAYGQLYTWISILRNTSFNVSIAREPMEEFWRNVFYQIYFRNKVMAKQHPFSGGIFRAKT